MTADNIPADGSKPTTGAGKPKRSGKSLQNLQRFGRSLMLPIAALPAAALLLRLGQDDLLGSIEWFATAAQVISAAGGALFDNLPCSSQSASLSVSPARVTAPPHLPRSLDTWS